jgi:hypothetical protein
VSRGGLLPQAHAVNPLPAAACTESLRDLSLTGLRAAVRRHIGRVIRAHGDWRPALDGLRPVTAELWAALSAEERAEFVARDGSLWNTYRHRMPPVTAEAVARMRRARRLRTRQGCLTDAAARPDGGLAVTLTDGRAHRELSVGWVVDCTGPGLRLSDTADPLWRGLLADGAATPGPLGMGVATDDGRLRAADPVPHTATDALRTGVATADARLQAATPVTQSLATDAPRPGPATDPRLRAADPVPQAARPLWTLGAARRGELWETTAIPEIRCQAEHIAEAVYASLIPSGATRPTGSIEAEAGAGAGAATVRPARRVRRPTDGLGFTLSTDTAAAAAYRSGVGRLLKVRSGAEDAFVRAITLDPGFALGHAALALMGHEAGADVDVPRALADAERSARERAGEHERSFVEVVSRRVRGTAADGDAALVRHLDTYPGDALALAVAVPTIAFSGLHDLDDTAALRLVERTAGAHGGNWFHTSLLAFMRQEQGRFDEAGALAERALADEPGSGHAMHALAHVHYECGDHEAGRLRLDDWLGRQGRGSTHRAHFSWHAALHELALEDASAVRRRWAAQLAPAKVRGIRALVDSGSLLWRARVADSWEGRMPIADVLDTVAAEILERPATAFTAMHAAVALTAAGDLPGLRRLHAHALGADPVQREVIAPLCEAFECVAEERWTEAAQRLERILPTLRRVGGSAAQREIVEETLLYALVSAGHCDAARLRLEDRLDRRSSPQDRSRLAALPS